MKLPFKKQAAPASGRRQVVSGGRPTAYSYHANRSEQEYNVGRSEPREQDTRRQARVLRDIRQRLGFILALLVVLACIINVLRLSSDPKVVSLTAGSADTFLHSNATYEQAAQKLLAGSILNGNKITINSDQIVHKLKQEFPELSDVSITLPLVGHRPVVYIAPTTPSLILQAGPSSFVLDENGKVLTTNTSGPDTTSLPTVTDQSGLKAEVNKQALPASTISFIQTVLGQLAAAHLTVASLTLPTSTYELDVHPSGVGYFVKFNIHSDDARQQAGTYLAVRQRLQSQNITPAAYIDVRVDGRAYYK